MSDNKFKSSKNDGFGSSKLLDLQVGDLVSWDSWAESLDTGIFEEKNGLLVEIFKENRSNGFGYLAKIIPFGEDREVIMPLISIRKMKLRN